LKKVGATVFAIVAHKLQEPGWPDRFISHPWWQGFIEFKDVNTQSTTKQRIIIRTLNRHRLGSAVFVRHPDRIEDCDHNLLATFSDARDLLTQLRAISSAT
jgi:hypothetical protein